MNSLGDPAQKDLRELLMEPQKKKLVIPDRAEQLEKLKKLKEGKPVQVSES